MSASDHLNEQQFMGIEELKNLDSGDFGGKVGDMKDKWLADANKEPQGRHKDHGGPQGYVDHLAASMKQHGMREPLYVVTDELGPRLAEGHHRALAAIQAGMSKVPVDRKTLEEHHDSPEKFFGGEHW